MIRLTAALASAALLLGTAGAAEKKPRDLIVGKWESQDDLSKGVVVEYKDDGTTAASFEGRSLSTGRYKFVEDDVMEFEPTFAKGGKGLLIRYRVEIKGDELIQVDLKTKFEKRLKRVK